MNLSPIRMTSLIVLRVAGGVAQLVEHLTGSQKAVGSSPITSTHVMSHDIVDRRTLTSLACGPAREGLVVLRWVQGEMT